LVVHKDINKAFGEDILSEDFDESIINLTENYYIVIFGKISDYSIIIHDVNSAYSDYGPSVLTPELRKLSKELNLPIKSKYIKYDNDGEYFINNYNDFTDLKNTYFYHGTSINYIESIIKKGLMSNPGKSNFKIVHKDKVFLTTKPGKALFHAEKASMNNKSYPIILKFKIPDVDKLVGDYDIVLRFYGIESKMANELGYSDIFKNFKSTDYKKDPFNIKDEKDMSKFTGIYGYKGRIPSSFINKVLFNSLYFYQGLSDGFDSLPQDEVLDLDNWQEYDIKELFEEISPYI
jgi:hypothetical protein